MTFSYVFPYPGSGRTVTVLVKEVQPSMSVLAAMGRAYRRAARAIDRDILMYFVFVTNVSFVINDCIGLSNRKLVVTNVSL